MFDLSIDYHWGYLIWGFLLAFVLTVMVFVIKWQTEDGDSAIKGFFIGLLGFIALFLIIGMFHIPEMNW